MDQQVLRSIWPIFSAETREQILEVARRRFLTEGYAATTIAEVAGDVDDLLDPGLCGAHRPGIDRRDQPPARGVRAESLIPLVDAVFRR